MTEQKKTRQMSAKGLLQKANAAKSAIGFFQQHREYMLTSELASVLKPIVVKVDEGTLMPTPGLQEVAQATMNHIIASAIGKLEASVADEESSKGSNKNWVATIYDGNGNVCTRINAKGEEEDLIKGFDLSSDSQRWIDRRLFEGASDWWGEMTHSHSQVKETVMRADSIARLLRKKKGPSVHVSGQSTKSLGWGCHVSQKRVSFSRG